MRVYVVPARYRDDLEAAVRRAVDLIRIDVDRRERGEPPIIPDFIIHEDRVGDVLVAVDIPVTPVVTS